MPSLNIEAWPETPPVIERNPYDGTFLIEWPDSHIAVTVTAAALQDLVSRAMVAQTVETD